MPLPGGATDKVGNRYENRWTVCCLADVMDQKADSIQLEPPGTEGEGVEFWLQRGSIREYHQVKRQLSNGRWTLSQLNQAGVLGTFLGKLRQVDTHCVFVSMYMSDQLAELSEKARLAPSLDVFLKHFLSSKPLKKWWMDLRVYWGNCLEAEAYDFLRRIYVNAIDEQLLQEFVQSKLERLVEGESGTVEASMSQFVLDSVHRELGAVDLWKHLEEQGFRRRQWGNDPTVLAAVDSANERYVTSFPDPTLRGHVISREEVGDVLAEIDRGGDSRGLFLAGEAAIGKSGVVLQLLSALRERGTRFLVLRIDDLEDTQLPKEVGRQIGLPGSPAAVLSAVVKGRNGVLVLDQLDAVSLASGRRPKLFDCIARLALQAAGQSNLFVVLVCRTFDLDNDFRFRQLTEQLGSPNPVRVKRLSEDAVRNTISSLGLDSSRLTTTQTSLLEVPLHLNLLAEVASGTITDSLNFKTVIDLYDTFWREKQDRVKLHRGSSTEHWTEIMDRLTEHMSSRQTLTAPILIVDDFWPDVRAIISEHVLALVNEGQQLAFFHEGFFDYVFARRFLSRGGDLPALILNTEQGLFRRAQVRQILAYERAIDRDRYLADLRTILDSPEIRSHLKEVVFALLAQLSDPIPEEWEILSTTLVDGGFPAARIWGMLSGSAQWFHLLDGLGVIENWLADPNDARVDRVVLLLASIRQELADRVAELVSPYIRASEQWDLRLRFLMQRRFPSEGRAFLDLFLSLIDEGVLDGITDPVGVNGDFWTLIYSLPERNPGWACEVIGHYFERHFVLAIGSGVHNPFSDQGTIRGSQFAKTVLMESAQLDPKAFVINVLPFVLNVVERTADLDAKVPVPDKVWVYRSPNMDYGLEAALLSATEAALMRLAEDDPEELERVVSPLLESKFDTVQYLVVRAFTANGLRFANAAADYLCQGSYRLCTGYTSEAHWATRELLLAMTPQCSNDRLARLENVILNYYPLAELGPDRRRWRGWSQFVLLEGIDDQRRGTSSTLRLNELRRKFPDNTPSAPTGVISGFVGSPVPGSAVEKMTDGQWLAAIAKYADDEEARLVDGDQFVGGAHQLAQQLQRQVEATEASDRFISLAERMPDDTNPEYFDAVLRGLAASIELLNPQQVLVICERCHHLPKRPCGRSLVYLINKLAGVQLPERVLEMVAWYALDDPDPQEELWRREVSDGQVLYGGNIESAGLNSVRGAAAEAIARLIFADSNRLATFRPVLDRLVADESIAVRAWVAHALTAALVHDRTAAVEWFLHLCQTEDALLGTSRIEEFLLYAIKTHYSELKPVLDRMLSSETDDVTQVGARQVCLAALDLPEAQELASRCLSGSQAMRLGAAEVYATNLRIAGLRQVCEEGLRELFYDSNTEVRSAAARCFQAFTGTELNEYQGLATIFIDSPAFGDGYADLLDALDGTTAEATNLICHFSERFLDVENNEVADIRTHAAGEADDVSKLVVRAYGQAREVTTRDRCLDIIDRMTDLGAYGLDNAIDYYER